jgi:transposase InsO family protein
MNMAYTNNPERPHVRMEAVRLVRKGWSTRKVARHMGFDHSTIVRWIHRAPGNRKLNSISTLSSRPHHHPHELSRETVWRILELRKERNQCAEILQYRLKEEGIDISISSVKRTLQRHQISRYSSFKKWHQYPERPMPEKPGILVEIDTIHDGDPRERMGLYTLIDVCSRWAHALPTIGMNTRKSLKFVDAAKNVSQFSFKTIQSDHGGEFSLWFTKRILERGMAHRHSRIRTPNDNAHIERFNRTIQEECISKIPRNILIWRKEIPEYLRYYNTNRPHMGLGMKTPNDIIKAVRSY